VSFAAPLVLLGLLVVPALGLWYVVKQQQRARAARAFTSAALTPSVAPRRSGWRRHVPFALLALALAALIVAAAKPQRSVAKPVKAGTVMFANDVSDSMSAGDVRPSRLVAAMHAATSFLHEVTPNIAVGSIEFARHPVLLQSPTTEHVLTRAAIAKIAPGGGGTAIGDALVVALDAIRTAPKVDGKRPPGAVILISDGASNAGVDPIAVAEQARHEHVPVYTVSIGTARGTIQFDRHGTFETTPVPVDPTELGEIARASGGRAYRAPDSAAVQAIYRHLAKQLGERHVQQGLDAEVTGLALVLLAAGAGTSLLWFGRLT